MCVNGLTVFVLVTFGLSLVVLTTCEKQNVVVGPAVGRLVVQKNSHLVVDCPVKSASSARFTWTKNGEEIVPGKRVYVEKNGSLIFEKTLNKKRAERNDSGFYECHAKNGYGTFLGRKVEIVISKMTIVIDKKEVLVPLGGTARFHCMKNGSSQGQPLYVWEHPGGQTFAVKNKRIFNDNSLGIIQIYNVSEVDVGKYACKLFPNLENNLAILEKSAFLKIASGTVSPVPTFLDTPQRVSVIVNEPALLECLVTGGAPVTITWKLGDGQPVVQRDDDSVQITGHSNIQFSYTTIDDAKVYICVAETATGQTIMREYTLDILTSPKFTAHPEAVINKPLNRWVTLKCAATGNPKPKIKWYKNGLMIYRRKTRPSNEDGDKLVIYSNEEDSGYYQCILDNSVGNAISTTWLYFDIHNSTPSMVTGVTATTISATEVQLKWNPVFSDIVAYIVDYYELFDIPCRKTCIPVYEIERKTSDKLEFLAERLKPFTNYSFTVRGMSSYGAGPPSKTVIARTFTAPPNKTPKVDIIPDSTTSFRVHWEKLPLSESNGIITNHVLQYRSNKHITTARELPGDTYEYLVTGLDPNTTYEVQVMAINSAGYPKKTDDWYIYRTPPARNGDELTPVLILNLINSTAVNISWHHHEFSGVAGYRITVNYMLKTGPVHEFNVSADQKYLVVNNLEDREFYVIDLKVKDHANKAISMVRGSFQAHDPSQDPQPPPPKDITPVPQSSSIISLTWTKPKTTLNITSYRIHYQRRHEGVLVGDLMYMESTTEMAYIENLMAFTWYMISISSETETTAGPFSKPIFIRTNEGINSHASGCQRITMDVCFSDTAMMEKESSQQFKGL